MNDKEFLTLFQKNKFTQGNIFNDVNKYLQLPNLNFSQRQCLEEFDQLAEEYGRDFEIEEDNNRVLQLYGEDKILFQLDIPNPLAFVNDQKRAKKMNAKKLWWKQIETKE